MMGLRRNAKASASPTALAKGSGLRDPVQECFELSVVHSEFASRSILVISREVEWFKLLQGT